MRVEGRQILMLSLLLGRKEITTFFYIYMVLTIFSLILDSGVISAGSGAYPYFTAATNGLTSALCTCLLINGFVGFQLYEDGTRLSVWLLRLSSVAMFVICGAVSICTFKGLAGLGPTKTVGLFVVLYLFNGICLVIYVVLQIILVLNTLQDRWPLGDIAFGIFFFVVGQVLLYVFGNTICEGAQHYLDGLFIATICNLLAVMMVYKVRSAPGAPRVRSGADLHLVLGFNHQGRSRVQRRYEAEQLGGQGTSPGGRPSQHDDLPCRRHVRQYDGHLPSITSAAVELWRIRVLESENLHKRGGKGIALAATVKRCPSKMERIRRSAWLMALHAVGWPGLLRRRFLDDNFVTLYS